MSLHRTHTARFPTPALTDRTCILAPALPYGESLFLYISAFDTTARRWTQFPYSHLAHAPYLLRYLDTPEA